MTEESGAPPAAPSTEPAPEPGAPPAGTVPMERRESRLLRRAVVFGAAATLVGFAAFGARPGLSVAAGAAISAVNMRLLRRVARSFTASLSARAALRAAAFTGARYILLGAALFAIIGVWNADPIGVVCGLGAPLLAVLWEVGTEGFAAFRAAPSSAPTPPSGQPSPPPTSPPPGADDRPPRRPGHPDPSRPSARRSGSPPTGST